MRELFQSTLPRRERRSLRCSSFPAAISIHAPAKGATSRPALSSIGTNFNPRSREGSDICAPLRAASKRISIHAPAKGATRHTQASVGRDTFQSTLPRRERPAAALATHTCRPDFNPRSREGSDAPDLYAHQQTKYFNPRSREGSDGSAGHCLV